MLKQTIAAGIIAGAIAMSGCSTLGNGRIDAPDGSQLVVQYATLKLIEQSADVTGGAVIDRVERLRAYVTADSLVELAELRAQAHGVVAWDSLAPSDRLLVRALFGAIESQAEGAADSKALEAEMLTLLDWVEDAASVYAR
jgi:hypothetical protein